jgi:ParB/RepB/Spo0J family partition protein
MNEIIEIRIDQLKPGDNPREIDFKKDEDMKTLLSTMETVGFEGIDPILVYPTDNLGAYEIDDGHRRFHCACQMEWKRLRAIVIPRPRTEADKFFKRGLRNLNQKKLTNGELTRFVGRLHKDFGWKQERIAKDLKMSQAYVSGLSTVYNFPILLEYLDEGGQIKIAIELARIEDIVPMQSLIEQGCTIDSVKEYRESIKPKEKGEDAQKPKETTTEEEREASTEEELDQLQDKGHLGTHSIPGAEDGKDGEAGAEEGISPDGGSDSSVGTPSITKETVPKTEPETPPSKPQPYTHEWFCWCGAHDPSKLELKKHDCINNGFQGYLGRLARDTGQMIQTSPKNGNEYWLKHPLFKQMAENPQSIVHIEQQAELQEHTWKKFKRALDNAKAKIGGS